MGMKAMLADKLLLWEHPLQPRRCVRPCDALLDSVLLSNDASKTVNDGHCHFCRRFSALGQGRSGNAPVSLRLQEKDRPVRPNRSPTDG
jgi:hypothetical protein